MQERLRSLRDRKDLARFFAEAAGLVVSQPIDLGKNGSCDAALVTADSAGLRVVHVDVRRAAIRSRDIRRFSSELQAKQPHDLLVCSADQGRIWHFVRTQQAGAHRVLRRIEVEPARPVTPAIADRFCRLAEAAAAGVSPADRRRGLDDAFDVETLVSDFFRDVRQVLLQRRDESIAAGIPLRQAHTDTLQTLIQALSRRFIDPTATRELGDAFTNLLERYPLSPQEPTLLDHQVAIDPGVMGLLAERLVNAEEAVDDRSDAGIFYTPPAETDLMCRLAVADQIVTRLGTARRDEVFRLVFSTDPTEQEALDRQTAPSTWEQIADALKRLRVLDPACGSGAFLVGMLHVLDDLLERAGYQTGRSAAACTRRKALVDSTLFGVDVMPWACEIARTRLALTILSGTDDRESKGHRELDRAPNIRTGDALLGKIQDAQGSLSTCWQEAFPQVFSGGSGGFDIVIGNPPYVRQEFIADPAIPDQKASPSAKRAYKAAIAAASAPGGVAIDRKSDLYIYFFFRSLPLLARHGSLCFVTSNTWLDVGYGASLQRHLLDEGHLKLIIDSSSARSFTDADVNTAITLYARSPRAEATERITRFVSLRLPYLESIDGTLWSALLATTGRDSTSSRRCISVSQRALVDEGLVDGSSRDRYATPKWGGRYLRAPEIYWHIMERVGRNLPRLRDRAEVRFGIKTGANSFFYLDATKAAEWGIEEEFLQPVIKSSRESRQILIDPTTLRLRLFLCNRNRDELRGTAALAYIEAGEAAGLHTRPSTRGRPRWWDLGERRRAPIITPCSFSDLFRTFSNPGVFADKRLYEVYPHDPDSTAELLVAANSTLTSLFLEVGSRTGLGEGLLDLTVYEVANVPLAPIHDGTRAKRLLMAHQRRALLPFEAELEDSARRELDTCVFDALRLTKGEREAVYEAVLELVGERHRKASSIA